jgi:hypothetical protein
MVELLSADLGSIPKNTYSAAEIEAILQRLADKIREAA